MRNDTTPPMSENDTPVVTGADAIQKAARYVLENSRRGVASLNREQFAADTEELMIAYRDIITKALASGFLARQAPSHATGAGWRSIETIPDDNPSLVGLWVTHNETGERWWEVFVISIEDETGEAIGWPDGEPLPWALADFEGWMPVPGPLTTAPEAPQAPSGDFARGIEQLGEALFLLSDRLRSSHFLEDQVNHAAYEKVVAAFQALAHIQGDGDLEVCPDCAGSGATVADQTCWRCNGNGGVPAIHTLAATPAPSLPQEEGE